MKILIVDDSVVVRSLLKKVLTSIEGVTDIGLAANGSIACEKLQQDRFDLVILDMEMPEMDGLETLQALKDKNIDVKCMIFASSTQTGARTAMDAFRLGACDVIAKPTFDSFAPEKLFETIRELLLSKIRPMLTGNARSSSTSDQLIKPPEPSGLPWTRSDIRLFKPEILVIASSTGGPMALEEVLGRIGGPLSIPILIAQHMPPLFTKSLAERLGDIAKMPAGEGRNGEILQAGRIYVAPGDYHMSVTQQNAQVAITLDQSPPILHVRPAANKLMESVAAIYQRRTMGLVLTGMGEDGKEGAIAIKKAGGLVLIQDQKSSVVWGMPGSVAEVGAYDYQGDLPTLGAWIKDCTHF